MATIDKLIPFIIRFEAGVVASGLSNAALFEHARKTGFANDPDDLGGATMIGVTLGTYTDWCRRKGYPRPTVERLRAIPYGHWHDVLKALYWDRWRADEIQNQSVAEILVDWVWASGRYGITIPQRLLGLYPDGIVGHRTISALNAQDPARIFAAIKTEREAFINRICDSRPANRKFRAGWLRRLNAITFKA